MDITVLALVEVTLLVAGGTVANLSSRALAKSADRQTVLIASVSLWVILFGIVPAFVFALYVRTVGPAGGNPDWEFFILGALPFTLVASPVIGFVRGIRVSRRASPPPSD